MTVDIQSWLCIAALLLMSWGIVVTYLFRVTVLCEKRQLCPIVGQCGKPTDGLHYKTLVISTLTIILISVVGNLLQLPMLLFLVIHSFYASYLLYSTADLYLWCRSTKQCFIKRVTTVDWLPR